MASTENNQVIADVTRDIVAQNSPGELTIFRMTSTAYFKNPEKALKPQTGQGAIVGFGGEQIVNLLTPIILSAMTEVFTFVLTVAKEAFVQGGADTLNEYAKKLFKIFRPEGKNQANAPAPLTLKQIAHVRKLAYQKFIDLKIASDLAERLADAIVATLVSEAPE